MSEKGNPGINKLAATLSGRMKEENDSPLVLDFGSIQSDGSLITNTFPVPIPKSDYSVCRQLSLGGTGAPLISISDGEHSHDGGTHDGHESGSGNHSHSGGNHTHIVSVPAKMRSLKAGDRILVA